MFAVVPHSPAASYITGDADLLSDILQSHPIDPHGSGTSTTRPPTRPTTRPRDTPASTRRCVRRWAAAGRGRWSEATRSEPPPPSPTPAVPAQHGLAVAGFGIGPDAMPGREARPGPSSVRLCGLSGLVWYEAARPVMDERAERILAAATGPRWEQMMITVLLFTWRNRPGQGGAAGRDEPDVLRADLAAGKGLGGRPVSVGGSAAVAEPDPMPNPRGGRRARLHLRSRSGPAHRQPHHRIPAGHAGRLRPHPQRRGTPEDRQAVLEFLGAQDRAGTLSG